MRLTELGLFYLRAAAKSEGGSLWLTKPLSTVAKAELGVAHSALAVLLDLQRAKLLEAQPPGEHSNVWKWTITLEGRQYLTELQKQMMSPCHHSAPTTVAPSASSSTKDQKLVRLTYMSRPTELARQPSRTEATLNLGEQAQRLNRERSLTGALLVGSEFFIQVLEGGREPLIATLTRINRDPRHRDVRIFELTDIKERMFSEWAMHLGIVEQVDPELIWRCVESFKQPSPANANVLVAALAQSVQAAA
jgi:hypothetical protein